MSRLRGFARAILPYWRPIALLIGLALLVLLTWLAGRYNAAHPSVPAGDWYDGPDYGRGR